VHFELKNPEEDRVLIVDGLGKGKVSFENYSFRTTTTANTHFRRLVLLCRAQLSHRLDLQPRLRSPRTNCIANHATTTTIQQSLRLPPQPSPPPSPLPHLPLSLPQGLLRRRRLPFPDRNLRNRISHRPLRMQASSSTWRISRDKRTGH